MKIHPHILIIDDDDAIRDACFQTLSGSDRIVRTAENGALGLEMMKNEFYDIIILDLKMPGVNGWDILKKLGEDNSETIVIVITGHSSVSSAVEAMKHGAYDFLPKPFTPDELRVIADRAIEKRRLALENTYLRHELMSSQETELVFGSSRVMQNIRDLVEKVSASDSTVLISGESGTGKELIARAIHHSSPRRTMPFVTVDCGTLVENLFESELFGHVRGSFTGATATKHGRLELANGGTVFFDEIGNIGLNAQSKLLRIIQEREIIKIGSNEAMHIDIRIVAATNKDLARLIHEGLFRDDLFYRLSVVPLHLPPLRERSEDIPALAHHFLKKYTARRNKSVRDISKSALKTLVSYDWPGNVRELENAIERAVVLTDGAVIRPEDLYYYGFDTGSAISPAALKTLEDVEKEHIVKTIRSFNGNKSRAASVLGVDRKTLRRKMKKFGIAGAAGTSPAAGSGDG